MEESRETGARIAERLLERIRNLSRISLAVPGQPVAFHVCELDQRVIVRVELPANEELIARFTTFVEEPGEEADDDWKSAAPEPAVFEGVDRGGHTVQLRLYAEGMFPEMATLVEGERAEADFRGPDEGIGEVTLFESDLTGDAQEEAAVLADLDEQLREAMGIWPKPWPGRAGASDS